MTGLDGIPRIVAYSPPVAHPEDLFLEIGLDKEQTLAPIDAAAYRALGVIALVLLMVLAALRWGVARLVHRPMAALIEATNNWRSGELSARARLGHAPHELARLAHAFDAMAEDLQARQEQLREAEARYRSIVDTAVDAFVVIDERGVVQSFNRAAEAIFGYAADEVVGRNVAVLMPEPDRSRHDGYIDHYRRTGECRIIGIGREVEGRRKDGSTFPLELSIAEWRVGGQRFFTGIMRDIRERREAQRQLEESHGLLTTIVEGIPDPVFAKDLDGRYLLANAGTCAVFGVDRSRLLGARDRDFCSSEVAERIEAADRRVRDVGETIVLEEKVADGKGDTRVFLSTKAPLKDADGRVAGLVGIAFDITQRKRAEEHLRAAKAEADRANLAKSKFLAAASHDLRQPAQSLALFLGLLKQRMAGEPASTFLVSMEQALEALKTLLDSLLDISKLDAGLVVARPTVMKLRPLLSRLASEHGPRAEAAGLRLRLVAGDHAVHSDPTLLEQALRNLIENALHYTASGGILLGCRRRGDRVRIEVVDTGIGIAPDKLEEVFEEFYQVGNPERDRRKGLGLGLAVVRRLARLLDHPIEVRSVPGRGSTFALTLPLAQDAERPQPKASAPADGRSGGLIVIEDDLLIRMGLEAMLEDWGHTVLGAESVEEAVHVLEGGIIPEAIIADYRLQAGTTGLDAIRAIHERLGRAIPATIVTGDTAPERLAEARNGGFRLLHKPVGPSDLRQVVAEMLAGSSAAA
jgi:PAS domain S-box-containing protein